jgi:ribosomal protein S12 methylthiotransferase accessory factor
MNKAALGVPRRPALASDWLIEEAGEGIFVARSERDFRVLRNDVLPALLPLLDGSRSVGELIRELFPVTEARLLEALALLEGEGLILSDAQPPNVARAESAYWRLMGSDASVVQQACETAECRVISSDPKEKAAVAEALAAMKVGVADNARFRLVVTRDYLDEELGEINQDCLREQSAWMLVRPYGRRHWIGPLFVPGETGCWYCLAWWLTVNGWSAKGVIAELPPVTATTLALAGVEAAKFLLTGRGEAIKGRIRELDTAALTVDDHPFLARPGCPHCQVKPGSATNFTATVSPLTGVSARVECLREWPGLTVYSGETSQRVGFEGTGGAYYCRQHSTFGVAESAEQAKTVCLAEAVERYSVRFHGDERIIAGSLRDLGARCVDPAVLALASTKQLAQGGYARCGDDSTVVIPPSADTVIGWVECVSLISGRLCYVPAGHVYLGYDEEHFSSDTNGAAAAPNREAATLRGLLELIERDAVALWWYNAAQRPAVDLGRLESRRIAAVLAAARDCGKEVHLLDLTTDFEVPVCVAIGTGEAPGITIGCAAHPMPEHCAWKALAEMTAMMAWLAKPQPGQVPWLGESRIREFPQMIPSGAAVRWKTKDVSVTVGDLTSRARKLGLEVLMVDVTRRELGIPVVRVVVPGLRPLARRLAPGRLYEVPVKLGWSARALSEDEMNPVELLL